MLGIQGGWLRFALTKHLEKLVFGRECGSSVRQTASIPEVRYSGNEKHGGGQQSWWSLQRQGEVFGLVLFSE